MATAANDASGDAAPASGASGDAASDASAVVVRKPPTFKVYEMTGNWPELPIALPTKPPTNPFVYKKITVGGALGTQSLASSCSIADYNGDGIPDVSAGRRWYEGPTFQKAHVFRGAPFTTPGHGVLPRVGFYGGQPGNPSDVFWNGVPDDFADWPWDVNGDGWPDIINVASPEMNTIASPEPKPQQNATAYWYENPRMPSVEGDYAWTPHLLSADMRLEHHNMCDFDGDGMPELTGACKNCNQNGYGQDSKGVYKADGTNPSNPWTFYPATRLYVFPFGGTGWMHGLGCGDVDGDGKPDLIERSGIWLQPKTGAFTMPPPTETCSGYDCGPWQWVPQAFSVPADLGNALSDGSATMFVYDVDGDGDMDVIGADWAHGFGLSWYEQTMPVSSCIGHPSSVAGGPALDGGATVASCFTKHPITGAQPDMYSPTVGGTAVVPSVLHSAQLADMDGDGLKDIVTGKEFLPDPANVSEVDPFGPPYLFVFKLVRDANPPQSGKAHFEGHMIDPTCNATCWGSQASGPGGSSTTTPCCAGTGTQITVGHANLDGIPDLCVSTKLGFYVFEGQ
jgi:hypothetical protein